MDRRNFKPHSCKLTQNGPDSIHCAVAMAQAFGTAHGLTPQQRARLAIVVEEAVTNLYDHGAVSPSFTARLTLDTARRCDPDHTSGYGRDDGSDGPVTAGGLCMMLSDSGAAYDPRSVNMRVQPNAVRGGGAGLALIRAWAQIVDYRSKARRNRLILRLHD